MPRAVSDFPSRFSHLAKNGYTFGWDYEQRQLKPRISAKFAAKRKSLGAWRQRQSSRAPTAGFSDHRRGRHAAYPYTP